MNRRMLFGSALLRLVPPAILLALIWWPEWAHYRVDRELSPTALEQMGAPVTAQHRSLLLELSMIDLAESRSQDITPQQAAAAVDAGSIVIPRLTLGRWPLTGYPDDIHRGPPTFRLFMSSLALEHLLMRLWRQSGDERLLAIVLDRVGQLARHEAAQRHDRGFLWNDHAIASRVSVLVHCWLALQDRPALRERHSRELLGFALRTGRMLQHADHFTVRTNHGFMQNLALLQLAAAFPALADAASWRMTADQRLKTQMAFYVSDEGVVLEHSPGYHLIGTQLIALAQRLRQASGLPDDERLKAAGVASASVLRGLLRPDGTLPAIGNTDGHIMHPVPAAASAPDDFEQIYSVAGWGLWWSGRSKPDASQTFFTWALHPGHGHKHADEGAFTWWSHGQSWITAVGYWPYGDPLVRKAYEWPGSNAPHGQAESASSGRSAWLRGHGATGAFRVADLERRRNDGATFRRTLLQIDRSTLLVLDFHDAVPDGVKTVWTLAPDIRLVPLEDNDGHRWVSQARPGEAMLTLALQSDSPVEARRLTAADDSVAGWTTVRLEPRETFSLGVQSSSSRGAIVTAWQVERGKATPMALELSAGASPLSWQVTLHRSGQRWLIARAGTEVWLQRDRTSDTATTRVTLQSEDPSRSVAALRTAYQSAVAAYPPWRDLWAYRVKVSWVLLAALPLLEILLWLGSLRTQSMRSATRRWTLVLAYWLTMTGLVLTYLGS